jgi:hypothetical protein
LMLRVGRSGLRMSRNIPPDSLRNTDFHLSKRGNLIPG